MTKTQNYSLNQWDASDAIRRADFNADNAAVDTALTGLASDIAAEVTARQSAISAEANARAAAIAALNTTVSGCGNCRIEAGTYTGTGVYGSANPNSLTFPFTPKLLMILCYSSASNIEFLPGTNHAQWAVPWSLLTEAYTENSGPGLWVSNAPPYAKKSGNTIYWYSNYSNTSQLNLNGYTYHYVAIG